MHNHVATPTKQWVELIKDPAKFGRIIGADDFPRVPGSLLTREWVESGRRSGKWSAEFPQEFPPTLFYGPAREPLVVHPDNGGLGAMGGVVPGPELTVDDVADLVGPDKMVDVIGEFTSCNGISTDSRRRDADVRPVAALPLGRVCPRTRERREREGV
jgi:F-box/leucine-rich repeat protein 10/11